LTNSPIKIAVLAPLVVSVLFAIIALFFRTKVELLASGVAGMVFFLASYLILKANAIRVIMDMKAGGYLSVIGFLLIIGDAFLSTGTKASEDEDTG